MFSTQPPRNLSLTLIGKHLLLLSGQERTGTIVGIHNRKDNMDIVNRGELSSCSARTDGMKLNFCIAQPGESFVGHPS